MAKVQKKASNAPAITKKAAGMKAAATKPAAKKPATKKASGSRPAAATEDGKIAGMSSAAVEKATGHGWDHWLRVLDKAGAQKMTHKEIAVLLSEKHGVPDWWSQMVTVGYEQARGMREKHETKDGFSVSASITINVPAEHVFEAWTDEKSRAKWLPGAAMTIRKATSPKSVRITWEPDGKGATAATNVEVWLTAKGAAKCSLSVQHGKLKTAAAGEKMKKWWGERLEVLKGVMEG